MPEQPPTTPSERTFAEREMRRTSSALAIAEAGVDMAKHLYRTGAQSKAVERLIEAADRAEEATNAARNAARLLL